MKITIDTTQKAVSIDEPISISELMVELKKRLSEEELNSFKIEVTPKTLFGNYPVIQPFITYPSYPIYPQWQNPYSQPWEITCGTGGKSYGFIIDNFNITDPSAATNTIPVN